MNPYPIIPMLSGLVMERSRRLEVGSLFFWGGGLGAGPLVVLDDDAGDVRAQLVRGVVGRPGLVLVLAGQDDEGDRAFLEEQEAGVGPGVADRARLVGDRDPFGEEARELVLVVAL